MIFRDKVSCIFATTTWHKRIVVGIDFSVYSLRAMEYAAGIAERKVAEIVALSVINRREIEYIKTPSEEEQPGTLTLKRCIDDETSRRILKILEGITQRQETDI